MTEKLNILMISDSFFPINGGREQVINNLMENLKTVANPVLLTTNIGGKKARSIDNNLSYKVIRCKSIRLTKNEYLSFVDRKTKQIIEELCNNGIDIIHTQTKYALTSYALKLGNKYNIPVVTTAHTNYLTQYKSQLKFPYIYNPFLNHVIKTINKHNYATTPSHYMKNILNNMAVKTPIKVIPNGDDLSKYKDQTFKKDYNTNNFIYVGRLTKEKNIGLLLQSLKIIKDNGIDYKMTIVGNGKVNYYKRITKKLDIDDYCDFLGAISDRKKLAQLYQDSLINLIPSFGESFGLTLRESASLETPSVVIENSAPSEVIIDNYNGFVAQNNPNSFAKAIINAIQDKNKLKEISKNCSQLTNDWEDITDQYINFYNEIINKKNTQSPV